MGGINIKLMQGIDETENQMKNVKQTKKAEETVGNEAETRDAKETAGKPQTARKKPKVKKNTTMRKKAENEPDKLQRKQVFSFRAMLADIAIWKAYAVAKGETVENLGNAAMGEYLKRHKLSGTELAVFEALKVRDGIGREQGC